jgi:hypothetical protein
VNQVDYLLGDLQKDVRCGYRRHDWLQRQEVRGRVYRDEPGHDDAGAPEKEWSVIGNDADKMVEDSGTEEFHLDVTSYSGQREPQEEWHAHGPGEERCRNTVTNDDVMIFMKLAEESQVDRCDEPKNK